MHRRLVARHTNPREREILLAGLERSRREFGADLPAAHKLLAMGETQADARLAPAEHAAWTSLALAVMNLDEALTKE